MTVFSGKVAVDVRGVRLDKDNEREVYRWIMDNNLFGVVSVGAVIWDGKIVRFTFTVGHNILNGYVGDWLVSVGNASLAIWPNDMIQGAKG